jgi:photosystem II stability/assembly factor-like uncharacterized protein
MSTDGGSVWSSALDSYYTDGGAIIMHPTNANVLYSGGYVYDGVSTYLMSVSKTTDGGTTWQRDTLTTTYGTCDALALDPSNANIVFAGGYTGVYKSTDAGATWNPSSTGLSGQVYDFAFHPSRNNVIYAASYNGVFKSTNGGASWTNTGLAQVTDVLIYPTGPDTVYAATSNNGVYKSTNSGGAWTQINTGLDETNVTSLGVNPGQYLFCGTKSSGMFRWGLAVGAEETPVPGRVVTLTAQPNPFRHATRISVGIRSEGLGIRIYDAAGRLVNSFALRNTPCALIWNGTDQEGKKLPQGVYFCKLVTDSETIMEKLVILK